VTAAAAAWKALAGRDDVVERAEPALWWRGKREKDFNING